jgi:hypothetical protein
MPCRGCNGRSQKSAGAIRRRLTNHCIDLSVVVIAMIIIPTVAISMVVILMIVRVG